MNSSTDRPDRRSWRVVWWSNKYGPVLLWNLGGVRSDAHAHATDLYGVQHADAQLSRPTAMCCTEILPECSPKRTCVYSQQRQDRQLLNHVASSPFPFPSLLRPVDTSTTASVVPTSPTASSFSSSDTVVTVGRASGVAPAGPVSFLRHPCLRFSAAHEPHDDRYAPARCEAACTDA